MSSLVSDPLGTVRGSEAVGPWVLVPTPSTPGEWSPWVSLLCGERVSHFVMGIMNLPVVGAVPGSPAEKVAHRAQAGSDVNHLALAMLCAHQWDHLAQGCACGWTQKQALPSGSRQMNHPAHIVDVLSREGVLK